MKPFLVDTLALVMFGTVVSALNELFIAGMDTMEVVLARLTAVPVIVLLARPFGLWRDFAFHLLPSAKASQLRSGAVDVAAILIFKVPAYALILIVSGASADEVWRGCAGGALILLVIGRPSGLWLDFMRRWMRV